MYPGIMQSVSNDTFGPLIAYLVPGATALAGLGPFLPAVGDWFAAARADAPTVGGFLYLTVASLAAGMTVSAVRWAVVDRAHARTGLPAPALDFARLPGRAEELRLLIEIHYRHYQFYANMLVALAVAYVGYRCRVGLARPGLADLAVVLLGPGFYLTSRETLGKYYARSAQLLSPDPPAPSRSPAPTGG